MFPLESEVNFTDLMTWWKSWTTLFSNQINPHVLFLPYNTVFSQIEIWAGLSRPNISFSQDFGADFDEAAVSFKRDRSPLTGNPLKNKENIGFSRTKLLVLTDTSDHSQRDFFIRIQLVLVNRASRARSFLFQFSANVLLTVFLTWSSKAPVYVIIEGKSPFILLLTIPL